ncbi:hypothetical protein T09_10725 [Trichinella sp. T9]|nr:hypothetical protein T09_10725 [Trichinella sp. T9]
MRNVAQMTNLQFFTSVKASVGMNVVLFFLGDGDDNAVLFLLIR